MRQRRVRDERGVSLLEVVVGMTIMVVFLAIFSGAVFMLARTSSHAEAVARTSSDLNSAFIRLDRSVRYASSISQPGVASGSGYWYVEFLTTNTGDSVCTQLRLATGATQLQARTWTVVGSGYAGLTAWTPYANNVTNGGATTASTTLPVPFTLLTTGAAGLERLSFALLTSSGNPAVSSRLNVTYTALNSAPAFQAANNNSSAPSTVCNQVART